MSLGTANAAVTINGFVQSEDNANWPNIPCGYVCYPCSGTYDSFALHVAGTPGEAVCSITLDFDLNALYDDSFGFDLDADGTIDYAMFQFDIGMNCSFAPFSNICHVNAVNLSLTITSTGSSVAVSYFCVPKPICHPFSIDNIGCFTLDDLGFDPGGLIPASGTVLTSDIRFGHLNIGGPGNGDPCVIVNCLTELGNYWDLNGSCAGSGSSTPFGVWNAGNTNWGNSDGTNCTSAWTAGLVANFAAGTDASGTYIISVSSTQCASGLTLEEGNLTLLNGTINLSGSSPEITVAGGSDLVINSQISGSNGFIKEGTGALYLGNNVKTYTGTTTLNAGNTILAVNEAIPDASDIIFNGGDLSTGDAGGFEETVGTVTLAADGTLNFGTGSHGFHANTIAFGANTLSIDGWTGIEGASGTGGRLFVTTLPAGYAVGSNGGAGYDGIDWSPSGAFFSPTKTMVLLINDGGAYDGLFELVPLLAIATPEPSTWLGMGLISICMAAFELKRRKKAIRSED